MIDIEYYNHVQECQRCISMKICEDNLGKIISRDFPKSGSFTATTASCESPEKDIMFYSLNFLSRVLNVKSLSD